MAFRLEKKVTLSMCELIDGYHGDSARTFAVGTDEAKALLQATEEPI